MKCLSAILIVAALLAGRHDGFSQGFVNLNFESTTLTNNGPPSTVSTAVGLPGWTAYIGGATQSTIYYNNTSVGSSSIAIFGTNNLGLNALQGKFSAELTAGPENASISQTGLVPADAVSILFEAAEFYTPTNFSVTLNGQAVNLTPLFTTATYTEFGGDVSAFADQTANLTFTCISDYANGIPLLGLELDNIQFSSSPVPEPSTLGLSALGGLFLAWRRWRTVKSSRI